MPTSNAMVIAAWVDPGMRDDVAGIVAHRFLDAMDAYRQRDVTIIQSLASLVLVTPAMHPDIAGLARKLLAREAKEHSKHAGKP